MKSTTSNSERFSNPQLFSALIKSAERKSLLRIFLEVVWLALYYRELPKYYFSRYLFLKDRKNILDYLPNKFLYKIKYKFNDPALRPVVDNKLFFDLLFKHFKLRVPKILMYNHHNDFIINSEHIIINSEVEFRKLLLKLIETDLNGGPIFVKKTCESYGGANIYKISLADLNEKSVHFHTMYTKIIQSDYLFQETVVQHLKLNELNPSCLNTLRIDTFVNNLGDAEVISAYFKTNIKSHYIDNDPRGGCEISINLSTGRLEKYGHLTLKYNGLELPEQHPVTGVKFENFEIPYFNEALGLAKKAAEFVPGLRLMGWDVAVTPNGPILIEGNSDYNISASDLAYGGYRTNPVFKKVLEEWKR